MDEIWKDIPDYEGFYQASNLGKIKSLPRTWIVRNGGLHITKEKTLKDSATRGYRQISLCKNNKPRRHAVHRLIIMSFQGKSKLQVNHIDGDKANNNLNNLEYCTSSENLKHSYALGLQDKKGEKHHFAKFTNKQILDIREKNKSKNMKIGYWKELSEKLNVHPNTLYAIRKNINWRHI